MRRHTQKIWTNRCEFILCVLAFFLLIWCLTGCEHFKRVEYVEVKVPVYVHEEPPVYLVQEYKTTNLPKFLEKDDPSRTSCLNADGEYALRGIIVDMQGTEAAVIEYLSSKHEP